MADTNVQVKGLKQLLKKLGKMEPKVYRPAVAEAGAHLKAAIATYPAQKTGRKQPAKTLRQLIFLRHAFANNLIDVPYRRGVSPGSQAMGRRWTVEFRDDGLTAVVGNNAGYVKLLHSAEDQAAFHKAGGWKTDKQIARAEAGPIRDILARHIQAALK